MTKNAVVSAENTPYGPSPHDAGDGLRTVKETLALWTAAFLKKPGAGAGTEPSWLAPLYGLVFGIAKTDVQSCGFLARVETYGLHMSVEAARTDSIPRRGFAKSWEKEL